MSEAIESLQLLSIAFSHSLERREKRRPMNELPRTHATHADRRPEGCEAYRNRRVQVWRVVGHELAGGLCCWILLSAIAAPVSGQTGRQLPKVHYLLDARDPPGMVASAQAARVPSAVGSFQPLSISGPEGVQVALARDGQFLPTLQAPVTTAMMVGAVYRFRVTNIPLRPGAELYPTVEVIDRVCAPEGREHRFPIPVVLTEEDLRNALQGALITRVIYVEDSEVAEPIAVAPGDQRTTDVGPTDNALQVADQLGRPVAILRIGSRVPNNLQGDLMSFLYGCPPWIPLPPVLNNEEFMRRGWPEAQPLQHEQLPFSEPPQEEFPRIPAY